jgi:hypothetical protein
MVTSLMRADFRQRLERGVFDFTGMAAISKTLISFCLAILMKKRKMLCFLVGVLEGM